MSIEAVKSVSRYGVSKEQRGGFLFCRWKNEFSNGNFSRSPRVSFYRVTLFLPVRRFVNAV